MNMNASSGCLYHSGSISRRYGFYEMCRGDQGERNGTEYRLPSMTSRPFQSMLITPPALYHRARRSFRPSRPDGAHAFLCAQTEKGTRKGVCSHERKRLMGARQCAFHAPQIYFFKPDRFIAGRTRYNYRPSCPRRDVRSPAARN